MKRFMVSGRAALVAVLAMIAAPAVASAVLIHRPNVVARSATVELPSSAASGASGLTRLGKSPGQPIANPGTHTLYVALQCGNPSTNKSCSATAGHALDVIDSNKCNPGARCRVIAKAQAGKIPLAEAIDSKTDTIYVGNATGTVTVVNGARCNAEVTSGCAKPLATIKTGGFVAALAFNPKTRTVYATNAGSKGSVFVIDAAKCNANTTRGCGSPVKNVKDPLIPDAVAVDTATNTVYAANGGPNGNGNTVSIIDGATCNGSNGSGCGHAPRTAKVGSGAFWDVVDQSTNTVYVANHNDGTVSVINGDTCNAKVASGCNGAHPAVPTGAGIGFLVVDDSRHTVFALNQDDDTLSAINTKTCNGKITSGCHKRARNDQATFNPPFGYNPNDFALTPDGTADLVNVGGEPFLGAVSIDHCNATDASRCRVEASTAPNQEFLMSADPKTHTMYAGNQNHPRIDVLNAATCNAAHLSGCAPVGEIPMPNKQGNVGAIDHVTHTLYAADPYGNTISVINIAHCKAGDTTGCSAVPAKITVGPGPGQPVLDKATHTLYAPDGPTSNEIAVLDASTCNAANISGCGQPPAQVPVGDGTFAIALSAAKNTVYAPATGFVSGHLHRRVALIDGATCNATDHSGCAHPAATVKVGLAPFGVAVDDRTHTVYVSNNQNGDLPGSVSIINSATCNGSHTAGCAAHMPTATVGRSPLSVALDPSTDTVYIADFASAAVSVLDGASCRAGRTGGCATAVRTEAVGSSPQNLAVDRVAHSVYVPSFSSPPSLSIFKTTP